MKKKIISKSNDIIDLGLLLNDIWKKRSLILISCIVTSAIVYLYFSIQPKIFRSEMLIKKLDISVLGSYNYSELYNNDTNTAQIIELIIKKYEEELKNKILSNDSMVEFFKTNKENKIIELKAKLDSQSINPKKYSSSLKIKKDDLTNKYFFEFPESIAEKTPEEYIVYVWKKIKNSFKEDILNLITKNIEIYHNNLEIAKKLNIEYPYMIKNNLLGDEEYQLYSTNVDNAIYLRGTIVLSEQINHLKKVYDQLKKLEINFNPILVSTSPAQISKSPIKLALFAFLNLLILLIAIIILKSILNNKI